MQLEHESEKANTMVIDEDLLTKHDLFNHAIDKIGIGIAIIDKDMQILSSNKQMKEWFPNALNNKTLPLCYRTFNYPSKDDVCQDCPTKKTLETGRRCEAVLEKQTLIGIRHYRIISLPIRDTEDQVTSAIEIVEDITEKYKTQVKLEAANQRFKDIALSCNDIIWEIDLEGRLVFASDNIQTFTGLKTEELIGQSTFTIMPDDCVENVKTTFNQCIENEEAIDNFEYWILHKDGSRYCMLANAVPYYNEHRHLMGFRGTSKDITEQKRKEQGLKIKNSFLQCTLDALPDNIAILDDQGTIIAVNSAWQDFAYNNGFNNPSYGLGSNYLDHCQNVLDINSEFARMTLQGIQSIYDGKQESFSLEYPCHSPTEKQWFYMTVSRFNTLQGMHVVVSHHNITIRKTFELAMAANEKKFKSISESAKDAIMMMGPRGEISFWNQAAQDIFGYTALEACGKNLHKLLAPAAYHPRHQEAFEQFQMHGQGNAIGKTLELEGQKKDGTIFPIELSVSSLELGGQWHAVGIVRDITARKETEAQRELLLEQVNRSNKELEDFAYVVSHDLKAPLRGIQTLVDWFISDHAEKIDDDGKEQLNLIQQRTQSMQNMIQGILEYSRIDKGQTQLEELDINTVLADVIDRLSPPPHIQIEIQKELPALTGEQICLEQVFQNLISNAIKYNDKETGHIQVAYTSEDKTHHFCVRDNGPGIAPEHHEKIFGIFQTLQSKDSYESTGIGLSLVKKIVEIYRGKIWIESEIGRGTTFHVSLPKSSPVVKVS